MNQKYILLLYSFILITQISCVKNSKPIQLNFKKTINEKNIVIAKLPRNLTYFNDSSILFYTNNNILSINPKNGSL